VGGDPADAFVLGVSIKETARRTGRDRNTIRAALRSATAPKYSRPSSGSNLDPFKDEIHRLLKADPRMPGQRVRELIAPLGFDGGKTIVDDYLREVRPLFDPPRTFQRTIYRPGEICQFDVWEPANGRSVLVLVEASVSGTERRRPLVVPSRRVWMGRGHARIRAGSSSRLRTGRVRDAAAGRD
jgi:hypothetical protein